MGIIVWIVFGLLVGIVAKVLATAQHNHMKKIGFVNVAEFSE